VLWYEDFPYVLYGDATYDLDPRLRIAADGPEQAMRRLGLAPAQRLVVPVDTRKKARWILRYESQIEGLFGSDVAMRKMLRDRRDEDGPAEFFWQTRPLGAKSAGRHTSSRHTSSRNTASRNTAGRDTASRNAGGGGGSTVSADGNRNRNGQASTASAAGAGLRRSRRET
jgi:hypothetical protein